MNLDSLGPAAEQLLAREEEMQALDEWLGDTGRSPTLVVLGGPGIGKSCVLRKWVHRRRMAAGADAARDWHVIQHEIQPGQDPAAIVTSLIEQCDAAISANDPDAVTNAAPVTTGLKHALERAQKVHPRLLIVLDGLDEVTDPPRLRALLPTPPLGIRMLCASRPVADDASLGRPPHVGKLDLDNSRWRNSNEHVCAEFWRDKHTHYPWLSPTMIEEALAASAGNILYATQLWRLWRSMSKEERAGEVPADLDEVVQRTWQRIADAPALRAGLVTLALAREPLQIPQISELAAWPEEEEASLRRRFLADVRPILRGDTAEGFAMYHGALVGPVLRHAGQDEVQTRRTAMIPTLRKEWLARDHQRSREYAMRHLLHHCAEAGAWTEAIALCLDRDFCGPWLDRSEPEGAAKMLEAIAQEAADEQVRMRIERLAEAARRPADRADDCEAAWAEGASPRLPRSRAQRRMLIATASPTTEVQLNHGKEVRRIKIAWKRRSHLVTFQYCAAASFGDIQRGFLDDPDILHIGCHGDGERLRLEFEPEGDYRPDTRSLVRLFRIPDKSLALVVLNCCESAAFARALTRDAGVPLAIGMDGMIPDDAAIAFVCAFYGHLALGYTVHAAFEEARKRLGAEDRTFPKLFAWPEQARHTQLFAAGPRT